MIFAQQVGPRRDECEATSDLRVHTQKKKSITNQPPAFPICLCGGSHTHTHARVYSQHVLYRDPHSPATAIRVNECIFRLHEPVRSVSSHRASPMTRVRAPEKPRTTCGRARAVWVAGRVRTSDGSSSGGGSSSGISINGPAPAAAEACCAGVCCCCAQSTLTKR